MVTLWALWVYRVVGAGTLAGGSHMLFHNAKVEIALAMTGAALPKSVSGRFVTEVGKTVVKRSPQALRLVFQQAARGIGWGLRTRVGVSVSARVGAAAAAAHALVSAITVGYVIGAVVGTEVTRYIWGDRGANLAFDFYSGNGKYGEYFDIQRNVSTIWNAYFGQ